MSADPVHSEDEILLAMTRDLSIQLGMQNVQIDHLEWTSAPADWSVSYAIAPDQPYFEDNTVFLSREMQGKLQPEEWRPLLASAMILHYQVNILRRHRRVVLTWLSVFGSILPISALLNFLVPVPPLPVVVAFILSFFVGIYLVFKIDLWARLATDTKVARLVGKQVFIQALQKAGSIDPDHDKHMGRDPPSIGKRIQNLLRS